jgi:hypothetical protein
MYKKILAIFTILLLMTIPFGIAGASNFQSNEHNEEPISLKIAVFDEDYTITTETVTLNEEELIELEVTISSLMDEIESAESWEDVENILLNFKSGGFIGLIISNILPMFSLFRTRGYVISSGHFFKLNPFKTNRVKISNMFGFWHYSSGKIFKDRTIMIKPLEFRLKILSGLQFGFMYKFFGIYLFISRRIPNKSYSFFMGTAKRINGIQLGL